MTDRYAAEAQGALRIMTGALLLVHGTTKLLAWPFAPSGGRVEIASAPGRGTAMQLWLP